jgi:hypothetical protein
MAQPLSFMFNVHTKASESAATDLKAAFQGGQDTHPLPNIVHYLWLIQMPDQVDQPADTKCMLLTTVYDEEFGPYVKDIARSHPALFDAALPSIVGMEKMVPVLDHLNEFAAFIESHDLTGGGKISTFVQNYSDTVLNIWAND